MQPGAVGAVREAKARRPALGTDRVVSHWGGCLSDCGDFQSGLRGSRGLQRPIVRRKCGCVRCPTRRREGSGQARAARLGSARRGSATRNWTDCLGAGSEPRREAPTGDGRRLAPRQGSTRGRRARAASAPSCRSRRHEPARGVRRRSGGPARGDVRRLALAGGGRPGRRGVPDQGQHVRLRQRRAGRRRRHPPGPALLSRRASQGVRAAVFPGVLPAGRARAALPGAAGQSAGARLQPLQRGGEADLRGVQRGAAPVGHAELSERADERSQRIAYRLDAGRPRGGGRLDVRADGDARAPAAASAPLRAHPAGAGRHGRSERVRGGTSRPGRNPASSS